MLSAGEEVERAHSLLVGVHLDQRTIQHYLVCLEICMPCDSEIRPRYTLQKKIAGLCSGRLDKMSMTALL